MIVISKPYIGQEEIDGVVEVLKSGMVAQGPKVKEFEERFAKLCGTKYAIAVSNGTTAIHAGLYAMGISEGDEVITTPFTFVATANPILMQGAKVVFADISEDDFCLDPKEVQKKLIDKTKAIIAVDLYGQIYNHSAIKEIADENDLLILEDAAQAVGATLNGRFAGSFGDVGTFSLYATKNIMTGEGGMVTTDNEKFAEKVRMYRHHGQSEDKRYEYLDVGSNYRLTDIAAAIGLAQLDRLDEINTKRKKHAELLNEALKNVEGIVTPTVSKGNTHVYHQYTIRITDQFKVSRDEFIEKMREKEVGAGVYYPKPLHMHEHFMNLGYKEGDFPVAEKLAKEVVSLPVHPQLKRDEMKQIVDAITDIAA